MRGAASCGGGQARPVFWLSPCGRGRIHGPLPPASCDLRLAAPLAVDHTGGSPWRWSFQAGGQRAEWRGWRAGQVGTGQSRHRVIPRFVPEQRGGWRPFSWGGRLGEEQALGRIKSHACPLPLDWHWEPLTASPRALSPHLRHQRWDGMAPSSFHLVSWIARVGLTEWSSLRISAFAGLQSSLPPAQTLGQDKRGDGASGPGFLPECPGLVMPHLKFVSLCVAVLSWKPVRPRPRWGTHRPRKRLFSSQVCAPASHA